MPALHRAILNKVHDQPLGRPTLPGSTAHLAEIDIAPAWQPLPSRVCDQMVFLPVPPAASFISASSFRVEADMDLSLRNNDRFRQLLHGPAQSSN
jgi:hypothetical protein